jgi:hypothetical protein
MPDGRGELVGNTLPLRQDTSFNRATLHFYLEVSDERLALASS